MPITSSTSLCPAESLSAVSARSEGFLHACATVRSDSDRCSDDERNDVICVAEVKRSRYRVLRACIRSSPLICGRTYPTIDRSSDCLLSASLRIFASTRLTSFTGSRRNTSSGSIPAQSFSPSFALANFVLRMFGVDVPDTLGRPDTLIWEGFLESMGDACRGESVYDARASDPRVGRREEEASPREVRGEAVGEGG